MQAYNTTSKKQPSQSKQIWHLVTNHQNMLYMLAAGMVMGPAGFRGKHYSDTLNVYPGWIPLFRDKVKIPAAALKHAISEQKHLLPCIASFDLSDLSGSVRMLSRDGRERDVDSPVKRKRKDDIALLVRAPLPPTLLLSVNFCSPEDRQAFESVANTVSNVDLSSHQVEIAESLFLSDTEAVWPAEPPQEQRQEEMFKDVSYTFGLALGGVLAMLYHTANCSDLGLAAFRAVRDKDNDLVKSDPILAELPNWMDRGVISGQANTRARLFWGVVESLVDAQEKERSQTPIDVTLAYLDKQLDLLPEIEFRPRLERLISDMRGCLGLGDGTITELFERNKGPLSRSLLLFCLHEHCTDLLEFSHSLLSDADYIVTGILFGVRDSWLQLPKQLRNKDLSAYVAFRMTEAMHRKQGNKLAMREPPRLHPLRELFTSPCGEWNSMQQDAALKLAQECNWDDCIQTHITLKLGKKDQTYKAENLQIILPGPVTLRTALGNKEKFMDYLGRWSPPSPQIESQVRNMFKGEHENKLNPNEEGSPCA